MLVSTLGVRLLDRVFPARLGEGFRPLVLSSWAGNLGDGIALAAGPLLVASLTANPLLVALAAVLQRLPFLLLGLYAGVLADRVNRRTLVIAGDAVRCLVVAGLVLVLLGAEPPVGVVLVALLLLGVAETFVDTTFSTLLPMVVPDKRDLGTANARLQAGFVTANQLVGPPLGAFLFAAGRFWPFLAQLVCLALGVRLLARLRLRGPDRGLPRSSVRLEIADGVLWLLHHPAMRTLALAIVTFNVTWAASWSVLVLYADERLGAGPVGFGLLTTAGAVGGLVGTLGFGWLEQRVRLATMMRVGLAFETASHALLALTTSLPVALAVMFVFGVHAFVWGTLSNAIRQRAVPDELQGRVASVYLIGVVGGLVVGGLLGGVIATTGGLLAPMWAGFVGSLLVLAWIWRRLDDVAHAGDAPAQLP